MVIKIPLIITVQRDGSHQMWRAFGFSTGTFFSYKPNWKSFNHGIHVVFKGYLCTSKSI